MNSIQSFLFRLSEPFHQNFWIEKVRRLGRGFNYELVNAPILSKSPLPHWRSLDDKLLFSNVYQNKYHGSDFVRFFELFSQSRRIVRTQVPGDFAEFGVYQGGTAKILAAACEGRILHLFDTFEGQPANVNLEKDGNAYGTHLDQNRLNETSVEFVANQLENRPNVVFHKGYFPKTAQGLEDRTFALVHLDGDQYQSIKDGCEFFYPRLSPGGCLLIHDYAIYQGVKKAVDEYFAELPEVIIELADRYGSVLIIKNRGQRQ